MLIKEIQLFLILFVTLLGPGFGLIGISTKAISPIKTVLYSFIISLFFWVIISTNGFLFHLNLRLLFGLQALLGITGIILWFIRRGRPCLDSIRRWELSIQRIYFLIFLALLIVIMYWKGSFQDGDAWYHVAQAEHYASQSGLKSESAYFSGYPAGTLYDFNAWHSYLGGISGLLIWPVRLIWINLAAFLIPMVILGFYYFLKQAFKVEEFLFLCLVGFFVINFIQKGFFFPGSVPMPSSLVEMILTPIFFGVYFSKGNGRDRFILLAILFVSSAFHIYYFLNIIYLLAVYLIFDFILNRKGWLWVKKNILELSIYLLAGIPYLLAIYFYCIKKYQTTFPGTEVPVRFITERLFILDFGISKWDFYSGVVLALLLLFFSRDWRNMPARLFICANLIILPFILFNPFILKLAQALAPLNLIARLSWNVFLLFPLLWVVYKIAGKMSRPLKMGISISGVLLLISGFVFTFPGENLSRYWNRFINYDKYGEPLGISDFAEKFQAQVERESVVISAPYTSYHLPAYHQVDIVGMTAHSTPPLDLKERIMDVNRFFNALTPMEIRQKIIRKYSIQYAVVNSFIYPWVIIPYQEILFSSSLYPDWKQVSDNCIVYRLSCEGVMEDREISEYAGFVEIGNTVSVFPTPDVVDTNNSILSWEHAGMIYIHILAPLERLGFNSKGGTHHVFYYCVMDEDKRILDERSFINEFSPMKEYVLEGLKPGYWVIFSGNGISPLNVVLM